MQTVNFGKAIGPYSPAVIANNFVFTSGQIPIDSDGNIVGYTIEEQAEKAIENLKNLLEKAGTSIDRVVKVTVFLKNMNDFPKVNSVYERHFINRPARSCVEVNRLPKDVLIEIEAIAELY